MSSGSGAGESKRMVTFTLYPPNPQNSKGQSIGQSLTWKKVEASPVQHITQISYNLSKSNSISVKYFLRLLHASMQTHTKFHQIPSSCSQKRKHQSRRCAADQIDDARESPSSGNDASTWKQTVTLAISRPTLQSKDSQSNDCNQSSSPGRLVFDVQNAPAAPYAPSVGGILSNPPPVPPVRPRVRGFRDYNSAVLQGGTVAGGTPDGDKVIKGTQLGEQLMLENLTNYRPKDSQRDTNNGSGNRNDVCNSVNNIFAVTAMDSNVWTQRGRRGIRGRGAPKKERGQSWSPSSTSNASTGSGAPGGANKASGTSNSSSTTSWGTSWNTPSSMPTLNQADPQSALSLSLVGLPREKSEAIKLAGRKFA